MSAATAPPIVPPRPVRAQQAAELGASHLPDIPPRPKRLDRSVSPGNYPRSPLNEPFRANLGGLRSNDLSLLGVPPRPPSVQNLPSIGQEGSEYADIQYHPEFPASALGADDAAQTRNVAEDLHLHAPKPSLPKSSATAQVQAVTKTDTLHTGSLGFGKAMTPTQDDYDPLQRMRTRPNLSRPGSQASTERRRSIGYGDEQGPAELGMRVPINPLLGDVQAPTPAPFASALTPTHTGHNGEHKRRHSRTKSGSIVFLPPGSYGLHGHGVCSQDKFEKDWYAKHPEQLQHEEGYGHGVYESIGSGRGNYAMSSDDLNKIVHDTASRGAAKPGGSICIAHQLKC
jgi:Altered inheritance of mitochondria protein 21